MLNAILVPVGILGVFGLVFGIGLAIAAKVFEVYEDPRVPLVRAALPGANCGGCGLPGCDAGLQTLLMGQLPSMPVRLVVLTVLLPLLKLWAWKQGVQ